MSARVSRIAESPGAAGPVLRLAEDDSWQQRAACRGLDTEEFYPALGGAAADTVRAVCAGCPVRASCLAYALGHESQPGTRPYGFWGGLSPFERRPLIVAYRARLRQDRQAAA
jgi:WhiB family redox-sensing transcriptional regulator